MSNWTRSSWDPPSPAVQHRAALQMSFYEAPSANPELVEPSLSMLARYVMDALWIPENIVRARGKHAALVNARDTLVRGAAERDTSIQI